MDDIQQYMQFWAIAISALLLFGLIVFYFVITRYFGEMARSRHTTALLQVVRDFDPSLLNRILPKLYARYAKSELTSDVIRREIEQYAELLWRLDRIGLLLRYKYAPAELVINIFFHMSIRVWLMFEEYIREIRKDRPQHLLMFEYLAAVCLARHIQRRSDSPIVFCDPPHHGPARKKFSPDQLREVLARMSIDLKNYRLWPPPWPIRRFIKQR